MKLIAILVVIVLSACASHKSTDVEPQSRAEGMWTGSLQANFINSDASEEVGPSEEMLIAVCRGFAHLWLRLPNGEYRRNSPGLPIRSQLDMHTFSVFHYDVPNLNWSEQQVYTLVVHAPEQAKLQWSRVVSNGKPAPSNRKRYFFGYGLADLQLKSSQCDPTFER